MSAPRDSAISLVFRRTAAGREVLWLQRGAAMRFGAGFWAFPGGKLDPSDRDVPVEGASGEGAAFRACAVRECFEETGLLLARGASQLSASDRAALRVALAAETIPFATLLANAGLTIHAADLIEAGRWITPDIYPARFDARMYLAEAPLDQEVTIAQAEAASGGFIAPRAALARWQTGAALLHPPNWNALMALSLPDTPEGFAQTLDRLREPPLTANHVTSRIEFQQGLVLVPQRTLTIPPATHTNAFLLGLPEVVLVDPGADDAAELAVLESVIGALALEGRKLKAIALTHHHHDHVAGAAKLQARHHLPIWAHPLAVDPLGQVGIKVDRRLVDGEPLALSGFDATAVHTPGHTRGHLAFLQPESRALLAGDLVSGLSTVVIDPPEGNLVEYLNSIERLLGMEVATLYPAHGPVLTDAPGKLRAIREHRLEREAQILSAVLAGAGTPAEIVPRVYVDTPPFLLPLAERSVLAHLEKLVAERKLAVRAERYGHPSRGE